MGKGLSKRQHEVLAVLRDHTRYQQHEFEPPEYPDDWKPDDGYGGMLTKEIVERLPPSARERAADETAPHRQAMFVVRRALHSLLKRGLVAGRYVKDLEHPRGREVCWTARRVPK